MTWIKLDDTLPDHPKFLALPDSAKWLYVEALCYANRHLTDGIITSKWASKNRRNVSIKKLIDVGLMSKVCEERVESVSKVCKNCVGHNHYYRITNYFKHQSSKEQVERKKALKAERNARYIQAKDASQVASQASPHTHTPTHTDIKIKDITHSANAKNEKFEEFWRFYPRKLDRKLAIKAFDKAIKNGADFDLIIKGIYALVAESRDPKFIKYPATWLKNECWLNPLPQSLTQEPPTPLPARFTAIDDLPKSSVPSSEFEKVRENLQQRKASA
jgi:hypothetical protein